MRILDKGYLMLIIWSLVPRFLARLCREQGELLCSPVVRRASVSPSAIALNNIALTTVPYLPKFGRNVYCKKLYEKYESKKAMGFDI